jgi:hypothetical protein
MKTLAELKKMGAEIGEAYLSGGQDMTKLATKTACDERLSQEEIHIMIGQANSKVITHMHEKVASGSLPYGSMYPTINPAVVVREVRLRILGPDDALPSVPPPRDYRQEVQDLLNRDCPPPAPMPPVMCAPEPTPSVMMNNLPSILSCNSEQNLLDTRFEARNKLDRLRGELSREVGQIREMAHRLEAMMQQVVEINREPAGALKAAMRHMKVASSLVDQCADKRGWDMKAVLAPLDVDPSHPLVKLATDVEKLEREHQVKLAYFDQLEAVVETVNTRLVELDKRSRRR